jgi:hypothetical protein
MNYIANKILMIRPAGFGYNRQTAQSNAFQKEVDLSAEEIQEKALNEFNLMTAKLKEIGVEVIIFDDLKEPHTPDSVFPNNWFSTHPDGRLCLYPMEAEVRRFERRSEIIDFLKENYSVTQILDFSKFEDQNKFLEGTGSLVLDQDNRTAYASISSRTNEDVLDKWAIAIGFDVIKFHSFDRQNTPIYHTNVMMCLGDKFAVICLESITDANERLMVVESLQNSGKEIIGISFGQMENFAGNMLLLQNQTGENILVMSERAFRSLNENQIEKLRFYTSLASFDIDIIEQCGGGSVRCMIAEIFLS